MNFIRDKYAKKWLTNSPSNTASLNFILSVNQSIYIPLGAKHRLVNTGKTELRLIEVQSGDYIGEDDIIRLEDDFGREKDQ